MSTLRENGKKNWTADSSLENINAGNFQRIADACELMASNYKQIIDDLDRYKRMYLDQSDMVNSRDRTISSLRGTISSLRGHITKLRNAAKKDGIQ